MTLLEVVVAISIFAAMYVSAQIFFSGSLDNRGRLEANATVLENMQRTLIFLTLDIEQMISRPVRDSYGDIQPALHGTMEHLEFSRLGWPNLFEMQRRSQMQRVNYLLEDGKLVRRYWPVLDVAVGVEPRDTVLLEDVVELRIRYLDRQEDEWVWQERWPTLERMDAAPLFQVLPASLEIDIRLADGRQLHRFFRTVSNPWVLR